jgi:hypothetical protein
MVYYNLDDDDIEYVPATESDSPGGAPASSLTFRCEPFLMLIGNLI